VNEAWLTGLCYLDYVGARKSGPRGEAVRDDLYGVAQGLNGQYGIRLYRGTCETREASTSERDKEREAFIVVVPSSAPHAASSALVHAYLAHRELAQSSGVVHVLGKDWSASDEALYYYEFAPGVRLSTLLRPPRRGALVLREGSLLFRHWAGELLRALSDVQVQCCHVAHNVRLSTDNVVVSGKGLRLRLAGLQWGPKVSAYREESAEELRQRMRSLMRDFGAILLELLGLNGHACWQGGFADMGRALGAEGLARLGHRQAMEGVEVGEGDAVVIELEAQHSRMYTSYEVARPAGPDAEGEERKTVETEEGPVVAVAWEEDSTPLAQATQQLTVTGLRPGVAKIVCHFQDLEATPDQNPEGVVNILVRVTPVEVSAPLKAMLRSCQIASGVDSTNGGVGMQGSAKAYLGQGKWRDRFSKFWIQDFMSSPYFAKMGDTQLDEVMAEYEALFETDLNDSEDEEHVSRVNNRAC
jgi:hypothetical protein